MIRRDPEHDIAFKIIYDNWGASDEIMIEKIKTETGVDETKAKDIWFHLMDEIISGELY